MTEEELKEKGWVKENETTYGRPDTNEKLDVIKTDNDDYLTKGTGRDDVYKKD